MLPVYGQPEHTKRKEVWETLTQIAVYRSEAWYVMEDFNEILNNSEKSGGNIRSEGSFVDFHTFMS